MAGRASGGGDLPGVRGLEVADAMAVTAESRLPIWDGVGADKEGRSCHRQFTVSTLSAYYC